jgi:hypothetical protein
METTGRACGRLSILTPSARTASFFCGDMTNNETVATWLLIAVFALVALMGAYTLWVVFR